jgi:hypothetical protein
MFSSKRDPEWNSALFTDASLYMVDSRLLSPGDYLKFARYPATVNESMNTRQLFFSDDWRQSERAQRTKWLRHS